MADEDNVMEGSEGSAEERSEWETASGGSEKEGTGDCAKAAGLGAYATRPEWRDVNPLRQDDGPAAVVRIDYDPKFEDVNNYLRAIIAANEVSQRALDLTTDAIAGNQANYTAWRHRWRCVVALGCYDAELAYTERLAEGNAKNYQLWAHRRLLATHIGAKCAPRELRFTEAVLGDDEKNYHAWSHRLAVVRLFGLWEQELGFTAKMLERDVHNNSAWNQRFVAFTTLAAERKGEFDVALEAETSFTQRHIMRDIDNEASWGYLAALQSPRARVPGGSAPAPDRGSAGAGTRAQVPSAAVADIARGAMELEPDCRFAIAALADWNEAAAHSGAGEAAAAEAVKLFTRLQRVDPLRNAYWALRAATVTVGDGAQQQQ